MQITHFLFNQLLWKKILPFYPVVSLPPLRLLHQSLFSGDGLAATFGQRTRVSMRGLEPCQDIGLQ